MHDFGLLEIMTPITDEYPVAHTLRDRGPNNNNPNLWDLKIRFSLSFSSTLQRVSWTELVTYSDTGL